MSDSPFIQAPTDPRERPILDQLVSIRDKLLLLKQDRSTYVKSGDVVPLYEEVIAQVHLLNDIRVDKGLEQNRVDTLLDDCFQLISLFFMTIGRNNEAPAVYSMTATISRLLDHLKEAAFYNINDVNGIDRSLDKMHDTIERGHDSYSPDILKLMENRIQVCKRMIQSLRDYLSSISPELMPTWEKLVSILRAAAAANTRSKFNPEEVQSYKKELQGIEATMKDHKFVAADGSVLPGQELTVGLLDRCFKWCDIVLERNGKIEPAFEETYDKLLTIRNHLDKLTMTQAWSLRETDLFMWQRKLDRIDDSRKEGNFWCPDGNCASLHTQRTLLYLIRRSYAYIYFLLISSEPVNEALLPIFNQLQTLRRCLLEVKRSGGVSNPRELYPYAMKITSIDNLRVDGKFMVGNDIPEGQGNVIDLLSECFDLAYELRTAAEEAQADGVDTD